MPSIALWSGFEFTANDGTSLGAGSLDVPVIVPPSTSPQPYQKPLTLATNASGLLWDAATGPSDFTIAHILSDTGDPTNGFVIIELETDEANTFGTQYFTLGLLANVPLVLGSSASYANYTHGFAGGTLSKIQKISAKNLNVATAAVSIRLVL